MMLKLLVNDWKIKYKEYLLLLIGMLVIYASLVGFYALNEWEFYAKDAQSFIFLLLFPAQGVFTSFAFDEFSSSKKLKSILILPVKRSVFFGSRLILCFFIFPIIYVLCSYAFLNLVDFYNFELFNSSSAYISLEPDEVEIIQEFLYWAVLVWFFITACFLLGVVSFKKMAVLKMLLSTFLFISFFWIITVSVHSLSVGYFDPDYLPFVDFYYSQHVDLDLYVPIRNIFPDMLESVLILVSVSLIIIAFIRYKEKSIIKQSNFSGKLFVGLYILALGAAFFQIYVTHLLIGAKFPDSMNDLRSELSNPLVFRKISAQPFSTIKVNGPMHIYILRGDSYEVFVQRFYVNESDIAVSFKDNAINFTQQKGNYTTAGYRPDYNYVEHSKSIAGSEVIFVFMPIEPHMVLLDTNYVAFPEEKEVREEVICLPSTSLYGLEGTNETFVGIYGFKGMNTRIKSFKNNALICTDLSTIHLDQRDSESLTIKADSFLFPRNPETDMLNLYLNSRKGSFLFENTYYTHFGDINIKTDCSNYCLELKSSEELDRLFIKNITVNSYFRNQFGHIDPRYGSGISCDSISLNLRGSGEFSLPDYMHFNYDKINIERGSGVDFYYTEEGVGF